MPGFYCKNKGHQPAYIPFQYINDGVCDHESCCDGSDEWAHVGKTKCDNRCKEIGKEWRKIDERRQRSIGLAARRRKELASDAAKLRQEVATRIQSLETEIQGAEVRIKGLQQNLEEVERQERGKVVKKPKEGGKLGILMQLAKDRMTDLRGALTEVRSQRDLSKERLLELEGILTTFKEEYNPNFNDEGVKRAVRAWEDYAAKEKVELGNTARDRDLDEIAKPEEEGGVIDWKDFEEGEQKDTDIRKSIPCISHFFLNSTRVNKLTGYITSSIPIRSLPPPLRPGLDRRKTPRPPPLLHRKWHPRRLLRSQRPLPRRRSRPNRPESRPRRPRGKSAPPERQPRRSRKGLRRRRHLPRPQRPLCRKRRGRIHIRTLLAGRH